MRKLTIRRLAYIRGRAGLTFATADEWRSPEYDRSYRAGSRAARRWYEGDNRYGIGGVKYFQ